MPTSHINSACTSIIYIRKDHTVSALIIADFAKILFEMSISDFLVLDYTDHNIEDQLHNFNFLRYYPQSNPNTLAAIMNDPMKYLFNQNFCVLD
jgi:hypothetical protein